MRTLIAFAWALVVVEGGRRFAVFPSVVESRVNELVANSPTAPAASITTTGSRIRRWASAIGAPVVTRVAPLHDVDAAVVGCGVVAAMLGAVLGGLVGLAGVVAVSGVVVQRERQRVERAKRREAQRLVELVDVIALGARAGLPIRLAIDAALTALNAGASQRVGRSSRNGAKRTLLRRSHDRDVDAAGDLDTAIRRSSQVETALQSWAHDLGWLGDQRRPVAMLLAESLRTGGAVAGRLEERSSRMRHALRHDRLAAARRLPVTLLAPLVVCTLPAFIALTVVPLVAISLQRFTPLR